MSFALNDFNTLISDDKDKIKKVDVKLRDLVKKVSKKLDYPYGFYKYSGRYFGYISKLKTKDVFINWQINSEDLSIEFMIINKDLILKFINNVTLIKLREIKKYGDTEIVVWDKQNKVIKLYPGYLEQKSITFLLNKIKQLDNPIFKIRKIYSRDKKELEDIENESIKSVKQLEIFFNYL